ncbi:hypothetical protein D8674_022191 [Pyrus ussuriensis x Pyrus communis]|uniref:Uncharacterized protein n=1 Tax=Pyrus ussuriensis x Pyrus communis TaxID=2448454 RepID=A0A5N5GLD2_9ROSA|nr:hypothetical protein D8674_022191 [Pyrus ussuriensis x Pyrus communis]
MASPSRHEKRSSKGNQKANRTGNYLDDRVQGNLRSQTQSNADLYQKVYKWTMVSERKVEFTNIPGLREGESIGSASVSDDGASSEDKDTKSWRMMVIVTKTITFWE